MPDPAEYSFEDTEEAGSTESYFFLRYRDSATVVYKVAVKDGKVSSVLQEVYHGEGNQIGNGGSSSRRAEKGVLKQRLSLALGAVRK